MRSASDVQRGVEKIVAVHGGLDISEEMWDRVLGINLKGTFLGSQAAARRVSLADLAARLGAPADGNITLLDLASRQGLPVLQVEDQARRAVADLQTSSPGPGPPVHGPGG